MTQPKHLAGLKLVLTGDFDSHERDAVTRILEELGADVTSAVSGKTTAVVAGKNPGETKLGAARKRALPVLNEAQLLQMIAGKRLEELISAVAPEPSAPKVQTPRARRAPLNGELVERFPGQDRVFISGFYQAGLKHGSWKKFDENGQLREDYSWERGVQHGPELDWTATGTKTCDGVNVHGKRFGTWTWWHENGVYMQAYVYDEKGRRQGEYKWDLEDGSPRARGQWLDDQFHGAWVWCREGEWEKLERGYDRGAYHGKELAWRSGGKLGLKRSWVLGKKHGEEETFDAVGRPTYKGQWNEGHPVGTHVSWDAERKETRTAYVDGIPQSLAEDAKLRDKVVKKLKKAKDNYAKYDVLREHVDSSYADAYLVHLWRGGHLDLGRDPDLWEQLSNAEALLSGEDLIAFLKAAKLPEDNGPILPYWPEYLDKLAMGVYRRDPAPIDAAWEALPGKVKKGVAFVRARFGRNVGATLQGELAALVAKHVDQYGLGRVLWPDETGKLESRELYSDSRGTKTPYFDKVLSLFGTYDEWCSALEVRALKEAEETVSRVGFRTFRDVIERATPETMSKLIDAVALDNDTQELIQLALTQWRKDDVETTIRIALGVKEDGLRKWPAIACAVQKVAEQGKEIPPALVEQLELADESPNYTSSWHSDPLRSLEDSKKAHPRYRVAYIDSSPGAGSPRTMMLQDAMRRLSAPQQKSVIERMMADEYKNATAAQYLHLVDDPALWDRFLDLVDAKTYGGRDSVVYGLGEVGLKIVPALIARRDRAKKREQVEGYKKAIIVALARGLVDLGAIPEELDAHVELDFVKEDYYWHGYAPFLERILCTLPEARAEKILLRELGSTSATAFARAFALIGACPSQAVLDRAFGELLERESKLKSEQLREVQKGIASLDDAVEWVRWIRRSGGGGGLGDTLKQAIGWKAYEDLDQELSAAGTSAAKAIDHVEKVRIRAADAGGKGERVYLLRRVEVASEALNVIGGAAPGVDAARWPTRDNEPMAHLFTLDLNTMPELRGEVGQAVRAISVFCASPDNNEAFEPGNDYTAIVTTTEAQLREQATPPEGAALRDEHRFEAVGIDVSPSVWSDESELHGELYKCSGRVLGSPIWLQAEEGAGGAFLMQFDESFCSMNLGDCGVMYVFSGTAFWQCH